MKKKYDGRLIHATSDEFGPLEVVEIQQKLRSLHFGNKTQQATMFLYNPIVLVHKYTQAMLTSLCWQVPERVLILGLGAGSLAKFLRYHFAATRIDAVELRPRVTQIAHDYFDLPQPCERFTIHHSAAADFLLNIETGPAYDLILVDLFLTDNEKDISIGLTPQLHLLQRLLRKDGNMTINMIGEDAMLYPGLEHLQALFGNGLYSTTVDNSNIVLLARHEELPALNDIDYTTSEHKLGLPFRQYVNKLKPIRFGPEAESCR